MKIPFLITGFAAPTNCGSTLQRMFPFWFNLSRSFAVSWKHMDVAGHFLQVIQTGPWQIFAQIRRTKTSNSRAETVGASLKSSVGRTPPLSVWNKFTKSWDRRRLKVVKAPYRVRAVWHSVKELYCRASYSRAP